MIPNVGVTILRRRLNPKSGKSRQVKSTVRSSNLTIPNFRPKVQKKRLNPKSRKLTHVKSRASILIKNQRKRLNPNSRKLSRAKSTILRRRSQKSRKLCRAKPKIRPRKAVDPLRTLTFFKINLHSSIIFTFQISVYSGCYYVMNRLLN